MFYDNSSKIVLKDFEKKIERFLAEGDKNRNKL